MTERNTVSRLATATTHPASDILKIISSTVTDMLLLYHIHRKNFTKFDLKYRCDILNGMKKDPIKKKEMTIDDLATIVAKGFNKVNKNFSEVNKKIAKGAENTDALARMVAKGFEGMDKKFSGKFDEINDRFKEVDSRFDQLETVVYKIDGKVDSIDKRLKKVEDAIEPLMMGYSITRREIQELNTRVFRLEKKVGVTA